MGNFYERIHPPTLGTTWGTMCILIASMISFSTLHTRPMIHEILIAIFVTLTTPITLMLLARAARSEERRVGKSVSVRVDLGGRRIIKQKTKKTQTVSQYSYIYNMTYRAGTIVY